MKKEQLKISVPRFKGENGFHTSESRSMLMSKIRAHDSKPELILRKKLWDCGHRYRKNLKTLPGKPDIVFNKKKLAIFVDGTFWHGYNWEEKKEKIKSNREFWIPKIERNMQKDREVNNELASMGFKVVRFWDFEIQKDLDICVKKIVKLLK